jgi:hypothetical protein
MATAISLFALGANGFRKTFFWVVKENHRRVAGLHGTLSMGGALCVFMLGLLLMGSF